MSTCIQPSWRLPVPPHRADYALDGESLVPLFRNANASLNREAIYQHFPGYLGSGGDTWRTTPVTLVQVGPWKLMEFLEDKHLELYNLSNDLGERHNLAEQMPEKAKELHAQLVAWREAIQAPMPTPNEPEGRGQAQEGWPAAQGQKAGCPKG